MNFNQLIQQQNNQMVTTTLDVANVFNKRHKHVLENVKNLADENSSTKNMFAFGVYENRGKTYSMYYMNRDGFTLIAMGFTGKKATEFKLAYLQAFNTMEAKLKDQSNQINNLMNAPKSDLFKLAYESQLAKEKSEAELKKTKPKAHYYDTQMRNPGLMTASTLSHKYGMSAKQFNKKLHSYRVIYKTGQTWHLFQNYKGYGYADYDKYPYNNNQRVSPNLKWTQKGEKMIYNLFKKKDILPESEQPSLNIIVHDEDKEDE